jgi:hypothetical protein
VRSRDTRAALRMEEDPFAIPTFSDSPTAAEAKAGHSIFFSLGGGGSKNSNV